MNTATATIAIPATTIELQPGEHYAGIVLGADGHATHHLVLLPARPVADLNWAGAKAWAASVGGELPNRQEQALLYANCKPHLQPSWHWSCQECEEDASWAWGCYFDDGYQNYRESSSAGSAVAVRRLPLESFNPFDLSTAPRPCTPNSHRNRREFILFNENLINSHRNRRTVAISNTNAAKSAAPTPKENPMKIETRTFINGVDASTLSDDAIFNEIAEIEAKIAHLRNLKTQSRKRDQTIAKMEKYAVDLAAYLDGR